MRRTGAVAAGVLVLAALVAYGFGVIGGDGDGEEGLLERARSGDESPDPAPAGPAFCDGVTALDQALAQAPDDPGQTAAFVARRITPAVAAIESNLPEGDVAGDVETVLSAVEAAAASGDGGAFDTAAFARAQAAVYPYVAGACDYQTIEVAATDDGYQGAPSRVKAGRAVVLLRNETTRGEFHEMAFVKLRPEATLPYADVLALPEHQAEALIDPASYGVGVYAGPGEVGGSVVELTPGRWVYACFVPAGTTEATADGTGAPHAAGGMAGELIVE